MPYAQWNQTKYHIVDEFTPNGVRLNDGKVTAIPIGNELEGGPAYTMCGRAIPANNRAVSSLPDGMDPQVHVCEPCRFGPGVPKARDFHKTPEAPKVPGQPTLASDTFSSEVSKVHRRTRNAAIDMFGPNATDPEA